MDPINQRQTVVLKISDASWPYQWLHQEMVMNEVGNQMHAGKELQSLFHEGCSQIKELSLVFR